MNVAPFITRIAVAAVCALGATTAHAVCTDGEDGARLASFELLKGAVLKADFSGAAQQIDLGGNRENNIVAALSRLSRQDVQPFRECVLLSRRTHSPQYVTEIVYFTDGAAQEYWLMVSGITTGGEVRLMDVQFSNDFSRFREWLE